MSTESIEEKLTEDQQKNIKKLALAHPELLYIILEEILVELDKTEEILRRALERWVQ